MYLKIQLDTGLKIIMLDQNTYVGRLSMMINEA